jgi:hypothetical protein
MTRTQFTILIAVVVSATVTILLVCSERAVVKPVNPARAEVNHAGNGGTP